jgi:hypothetical protein
MVGPAPFVRPLAAIIAAISIGGVAARAEDPPGPGKDEPWPAERQSYYYDRLLTDADFGNATVGFTRLLRNTIYAKAGRPFKDWVWREYFEQKPWYHERPEGAAKLSGIDEANLRTIKRWEAKLLEAQAREFDSTFKLLVPRGPSAGGEWPPRPDCEADARGVIADRKIEEKLVTLSTRIRWSDGKHNMFGFGYDYVSQGSLDTRGRGVRLACLPDLDGDGTPESVVAIIYPHGGGPDDTGSSGGHVDTFQLMFLVSGKSPGWRGVAPLAISGYQMGVEGSESASVQLIKLEDGQWGLAVRTFTEGCGDEDCSSGEVVRRYSLKKGKLTQIGAPSVRTKRERD